MFCFVPFDCLFVNYLMSCSVLLCYVMSVLLFFCFVSSLVCEFSRLFVWLFVCLVVCLFHHLLN